VTQTDNSGKGVDFFWLFQCSEDDLLAQTIKGVIDAYNSQSSTPLNLRAEYVSDTEATTPSLKSTLVQTASPTAFTATPTPSQRACANKI
jgi:hypothetical protein